MRIRHPAVTSNFLKLVGTYELDLDLGPEVSFPLRLELFKDTERKGWFRARTWEFEHFNLEPTFPAKRKGKPLRFKSMELVMLERSTQLSKSYDRFKAKDEADAISIVVKDLTNRLAHWT